MTTREEIGRRRATLRAMVRGDQPCVDQVAAGIAEGEEEWLERQLEVNVHVGAASPAQPSAPVVGPDPLALPEGMEWSRVSERHWNVIESGKLWWGAAETSPEGPWWWTVGGAGERPWYGPYADEHTARCALAAHLRERRGKLGEVVTPAERDAAAAMAIWLTVAALCRYYANLVWFDISLGAPRREVMRREVLRRLLSDRGEA